jgi:hypothetical protein
MGLASSSVGCRHGFSTNRRAVRIGTNPTCTRRLDTSGSCEVLRAEVGR